jgi:hypothetical protein
MIPKSLPDAESTGAVPIGTKLVDHLGRRFVRVIGGFAVRDEHDRRGRGALYSADELAYPVTVSTLPEVSA